MYDQVYDGEWWDLPKEMLLQCCSCGLVHNVKIRIHRGKPQICFTRNRNETRKARRKRR
jgi:hypothetical protein